MIYNIISGQLGALICILLLARSYQKDFKVANMDFSVKKFINTEFINIILSMLSPFVLALIWEELAEKYPKIDTLVRTMFFLVGLMGYWLIDLVNSQTKKVVRTTVDEKTNIADGK